MAEIVRMPKLSDTMTEGVVAEWHKEVGDKVSSGDLLAEIETDKATMDFESYQDGTLLYRGVEKGKGAPVESILAILGKEGEDVSEILEKEKKAASEEKAEESEKKEEKSEQKEDASKSEEKQKEPAAVSAGSASSSTRQVAPSNGSSSNGRLKASPLAKRMAEDRGIDISNVHGSGDGGRIIKRDIEHYEAQPAASGSGVAMSESYHEEPVSQMRKTIARRLAESKFNAPHFYLTIDVDMDNAVSTRKQVNEVIAPDKVSFNDLVIKAVATALHKHPYVNASWEGDKIRFNEHVHIGVAVAVEEGLLVPVVRFADSKTLTTIGNEVKEYAEKARNKKLQPKDWEGNTFTVSNLGMFGIEEFTAIINPPDSCILAIGAIRQVPVVKNGQVVAGNRMKVTLSCDHRVVDGAKGAQFLQTFKENMENPVLMIAR